MYAINPTREAVRAFYDSTKRPTDCQFFLSAIARLNATDKEVSLQLSAVAEKDGIAAIALKAIRKYAKIQPPPKPKPASLPTPLPAPVRRPDEEYKEDQDGRVRYLPPPQPALPPQPVPQPTLWQRIAAFFSSILKWIKNIFCPPGH
jgi:hypothetical protein